MFNGLTTERLELRPVRPEHCEQVQIMATDFEVVRHTGTWPWPADPDFTAERCAVGFGESGGWLVAHRGADLVGMIGLRDDGDLGYMLARHAWGQGYATEMGRAVVSHAFETGRWDVLKACVFQDNPASARVLEKLGFVQGAACEGHCAARLGHFPIRTYQMTRPRG